MYYHVKELSPNQRLVVEGLLGRAVKEDEAVSVNAIAPNRIVPSSLSDGERRSTLEALRRYFDRVDSQRAPIGDEDEDEIITDAIRSVRPNYRPIE